MKILEIYAEEFGCFEERRFHFGDGLHIIEGKNESGKSTLQALFRFLFYGFPRRAGAQGEERDKRLSHKGKRAAAAITFLFEGEEYYLRRHVVLRGSAKRESVSEELSLVRLSDGKEVSTEGKTPGEFFFGMPFELYQSSFCVQQNELSAVSAAETGGALGDFLWQDTEDTRIEKAQALLTAARRTLQYQRGRGGKISDLEDELQGVKNALDRAAVTAQELKEKKGEKDALLLSLTQYENESKALSLSMSAVALDTKLKRYDAWHEALREEKEAKARLDEGEALNTPCDTVPNGAFVAKAYVALEQCERADAYVTVCRAEAARSREDLTALSQNPLPKKVVAAGGATVILQKARHLVRRECRLRLWAILTAPLLPISLPFYFLFKKASKEKKALLAEFSQNDVVSLEAMLTRATRILEQMEDKERELALRSAQLREAEASYAQTFSSLGALFTGEGMAPPLSVGEAKRALMELETKKQNGAWLREEQARAYQRAVERRRFLEEGLDPEVEGALREERKSLPTPTEGEEALRRAWQEASGAFERAKTQYHEAEKEVAVMAATLPDMALLSARQEEIEAELVRCREKLQAIQWAGEALLEAGEQVRSSVLPRMAETAGRLFCRLVDGAHEGLLIEQNFAVKVKTKNGIYPLSHFSTGCRDAAYIAIRLALCEVLGKEPLPLLFDEVAAHLDDKRAEKLLDFLKEYCEGGRQGLLFTCHTRERRLLGDGGYTHLSLS